MNLQAFQALLGEQNDSELMTEIQAEARAKHLKEVFDELLTQDSYNFKVGQLVQRRQLRLNYPYRIPGRFNEPVLVLAINQTSTLRQPGTRHLNETMLVLLVDAYGDIERMKVDPLFFEPYTGPR